MSMLPDHTDPEPDAPHQVVRTHTAIHPELCGSVVHCADGVAVVVLTTAPQMGVDAKGLVHGGFVFGAADHAAMVAVNDPNVVLGAAETRFTAPVAVGAQVVCRATLVSKAGRKGVVEVVCTVGDTTVMTGTFTTFVLDRHVLDASSPGA